MKKVIAMALLASASYFVGCSAAARFTDSGTLTPDNDSSRFVGIRKGPIDG